MIRSNTTFLLGVRNEGNVRTVLDPSSDIEQTGRGIGAVRYANAML